MFTHTLLLIVAHVMASLSYTNCACSIKKTDLYTGNRLDGFAMDTFIGIGRMKCEKRCMAYPKCLSINYNLVNYTCDLNTVADDALLTSVENSTYDQKVDFMQVRENQSMSHLPNLLSIVISVYKKHTIRVVVIFSILIFILYSNKYSNNLK